MDRHGLRNVYRKAGRVCGGPGGCTEAQEGVRKGQEGARRAREASTDPENSRAPSCPRRQTGQMTHQFWPLFDLRLRTPGLEIRLPSDAECIELAEAAAAGIHGPDEMPFLTPWTDAPTPQLQQRALQWWWRARAEWSASAWTFTGAVFVAGQAVGVQDLVAKDFGDLRVVNTGSWLTQSCQGRGLGREMRAAILELAFSGLGAVEAHTSAWHDNFRSLRVSEALGYQPNGEELALRRGKPTRHLNLRLDRSGWMAHRGIEVEISGLDACRHMFDATTETGD